MRNTAAVCVLILFLCLSTLARPNGHIPVEHADDKIELPVSEAPVTTPASVSSLHTAQSAKNDSTTTTSAPTKMPDTPTASSVIPTNTTNTPGLTTTIAPATNKAPTTNATTPTMTPTKVSTTPVPVDTTTKPAAPSTTEHSKVVSTTAAPIVARSFDGASFIGGIILTLGLLATGFMGFKYYKTQTERNYHTL